jgi:hypothetical protein
MPAYDSRTKLEALRDHFEIFAKGANYLLIGHGAGFVGCLSFLMQHAEKEQAQFQLLGSCSAVWQRFAARLNILVCSNGGKTERHTSNYLRPKTNQSLVAVVAKKVS